MFEFLAILFLGLLRVCYMTICSVHRLMYVNELGFCGLTDCQNPPKNVNQVGLVVLLRDQRKC